MAKPRVPIWRVRVKRAHEEWVDVEAQTAELAEIEATKIPFVISVFTRSAIPGEQKLFPESPRAIDD